MRFFSTREYSEGQNCIMKYRVSLPGFSWPILVTTTTPTRLIACELYNNNNAHTVFRWFFAKFELVCWPDSNLHL